MANLSDLVAARLPSGGEPGEPIRVRSNIERLALTGLEEGVIVEEVGEQAVGTFTVNFGDSGGDTKTGTQTQVLLTAWIQEDPGFLNSPAPFVGASASISGIAYANGSSASTIAAAIATYFNTYFADHYSSVAVGAVVTCTAVKKGLVSSVATRYNNSHAGFITAATSNSGTSYGSTYRLIDSDNIDSEDGWEKVDILKRNVLIANDNSFARPPLRFQGVVSDFAYGGAVSHANEGITYLSAPMFLASAIAQFELLATAVFDFGYNAIPTAVVDSILNYLATAAGTNGVTSGSIELGGGTNGKPTYIVEPVTAAAATWDFDFASLDVDALWGLRKISQKVRYTYSGAEGPWIVSVPYDDSGFAGYRTLTVNYNDELDFVDSTTDTMDPNNPSVTVGIQDTPTDVDVVTYVAAAFYAMPSMMGGEAIPPAGELPWRIEYTQDAPFITGTYYEMTVSGGDWQIARAWQAPTQGQIATFTIQPGSVIFVVDTEIPIESSSEISPVGAEIARLRVGIQNDPLPTVNDIGEMFTDLLADKIIDLDLATFLSTSFNSTMASMMNISYSDETFYPISAATVAYGLGEDHTPGTVGVEQVLNADLDALIAAGWHGSYNNPSGTYTSF